VDVSSPYEPREYSAPVANWNCAAKVTGAINAPVTAVIALMRADFIG